MLLVHLDNPGPRQRYIVQHLLERMIGWSVRFTRDASEYHLHDGPKLWYGPPDQVGNGLVIAPAFDLAEVRTGMSWPDPTLVDGLPVIHPVGTGHDPFADAFLLLSLVDEQGTKERDTHGRVMPSALYLVRHQLSQLALVDRWALRLADQLRVLYPALPPVQRHLRHVITVDVDNGLKYLGRPAARQLAAAFRDLLLGRWAGVTERLGVLLGRNPDPFDRYERIVALRERPGVDRVIAFLLMRGGGTYDHACDHQHPRFRAAVRALHTGAEVGLHPSYASSTDGHMAREDRQRLETIIGSVVTTNRQHFLRWELPRTLMELEEAGFTEDHTLGFADRLGFRAGTCTSFPFYDLQDERPTTMMLWPFATMDSALHDRMGVPAAQAMAHIGPVIDEVRGVGGTLVTTWHDRFLSDSGPWRGWWAVLEQTLQAARP
jgi:hypothetical protein